MTCFRSHQPPRSEPKAGAPPSLPRTVAHMHSLGPPHCVPMKSVSPIPCAPVCSSTLRFIWNATTSHMHGSLLGPSHSEFPPHVCVWFLQVSTTAHLLYSYSPLSSQDSSFKTTLGSPHSSKPPDGSPFHRQEEGQGFLGVYVALHKLLHPFGDS